MHNFVKLERNYSAYGGTDCRKDSVILDGTPYMLKYFSDKNDPICEFIGCHVFELLGINAQKTDVGIYNGEVVVLCSDFREEKDLVEFNKIANSCSEGRVNSLISVLDVLNESYFFTGLNVDEFFWRMFVIDFIIDNQYRDNTNWGLLCKGKYCTVAPVYDCGGCLRVNKDHSIREFAEKSDCFFTDDYGFKIMPFELIRSKKYSGCSKAVDWIVKQDFNKVYRFIEGCTFVSKDSRKFYLDTIKTRIEMLRNLC